MPYGACGRSRRGEVVLNRSPSGTEIPRTENGRAQSRRRVDDELHGQGQEQELTGKAKQRAGDATDNERLQAEGQAQETAANAKQAGEHVKDAGRDVRDAFS
jgi:uncharacterized protein YjbJ (UPF0337 family)